MKCTGSIGHGHGVACAASTDKQGCQIATQNTIMTREWHQLSPRMYSVSSSAHALTVDCLQDGLTPLMAAAEWGHADAVRELLAAPGINVTAKNKVKTLRHIHPTLQLNDKCVVSRLFLQCMYCPEVHTVIYQGSSSTSWQCLRY
jgi:Ankyrin repeat